MSAEGTPTLTDVERALAAHHATPAEVAPGTRWAAVLLTLRAGTVGGGPELLFIRRAERTGDPWSGHVAFPGGRHDPEDRDLAATALRETWEEVGVDVTRHGRLLAPLDDLYPRTPRLPPVVVRPFVAVLDADVATHPNAEVAATFWVPLALLLAPGATHLTEVLLASGERMRVPSFRHEEHVIWGMTERILQRFLDLLRMGAPVREGLR